MTNPQLAASSSSSAHRPRICSEGYIPRWENPFPVPEPGQDPVIVEKAMSTFTMERGVTRVTTHLASSINVDHMLSRVLMGKMFGQPLDARLIKWKLGLMWKHEVKSTFYLDHFGRKWFALEFTDEDDLKYVLNNRPWYVWGQIFHLERWTQNFKDTDIITNLVVWARLPGVQVQYKEEQIIRDITQPIGKVIRVDEVTLGLNGLFVKVLLEVDLRFPLKRVLIINHDEDSPILISYEKLFEVCFYCGRRRLEGHSCAEFETDDGCFMINKAFEDEPTVYLENVVVDEDIKACLQDNVMLCFPKAANVEEDYME